MEYDVILERPIALAAMLWSMHPFQRVQCLSHNMAPFMATRCLFSMVYCDSLSCKPLFFCLLHCILGITNIIIELSFPCTWMMQSYIDRGPWAMYFSQYYILALMQSNSRRSERSLRYANNLSRLAQNLKTQFQQQEVSSIPSEWKADKPLQMLNYGDKPPAVYTMASGNK